MIRRALPTLSLALAAPAMVSAAAPDDLDGVAFAQVTIRERIVIRIPRMTPAPVARTSFTAPAAPVRWRERKAPECIASSAIANAMVSREGDIDLIASDGRRYRAKLDEDCPTLSFYSGMYLRRADDGMICAKRDALRSRSGARCEISKFRRLEARK